ncbi:hypothetical protein GCM10010520_54400 [Rhizobium viscosum]
MIDGLEGDFEQAQKIIADGDDGEAFYRPLDFDLRCGPIGHHMDLDGILVFDFNLDACLQEIDQVHGRVGELF